MSQSTEQLDARFRTLLNNIPIPTFVYDQQTLGYLAVNAAAVANYGYTEEQFLKMRVTDIRSPEDVPRLLEVFETLDKDARNLGIWRHRKRDGTFFDVEIITQDVELVGKHARLVVAHDVSERRAQDAVYQIADAAAAVGSLQELLHSVHGIVSRVIDAPNFYIALLGPGSQTLEFPYYADEVDAPPVGPQPLGRGLTEYVLRLGEPVVFSSSSAFEQLMRTGEVELLGAPSLSWIGVPLKTQQRTVGMLAAQIYSGPTRYGERDQKFLKFVSSQVALAIERKQGEESLRESEKRFRALIENATDGIMLVGGDGSVSYRSPATAQILGYPLEEPLGKLIDYVHPDDIPAMRALIERALSAPGVPMQGQSRARHQDGSHRTIEFVIRSLLSDPAVRGVVINFRDATDRQRLEAQLRMADRMASMGTLAAGVAHEINNPLAYVIANLDFSVGALPEVLEGHDKLLRGQVESALKESQEGAERVRHIVRDLKIFSRADENEEGPVDLQRVIDASVNMARNEIRHRAMLVKDYARNLPMVIGNESRLSQVFLNLLVNAAQAIPEGSPAKNEVRVATRADAGKVIVEVRDTGAGIPREHRAQLFDPFFTTKPVGVGTGLGLYICQNIVRSLGGELTFESEQGKGTLFRVTLPVGPVSERAQPVPARAFAAGGSSGRILVVDDEELIGAALERVLRGHEVVVVTAAHEALSRVRAGEQFDLILCDVMMPEMNGVELYQALRSEAPALADRVVFITGGAFTQSARSFLESVPNQKVEKPIDLQRLRKLVEERLLARGARS